jgi:hypothetical protein
MTTRSRHLVKSSTTQGEITNHANLDQLLRQRYTSPTASVDPEFFINSTAFEPSMQSLEVPRTNS